MRSSKGLPLGIAPEGTRSLRARLQEGKLGTVLVALKAGVPIVPVGIAGTEKVFQAHVDPAVPQDHGQFRPGLHPAAPGPRPPHEQMKEYTDEIMCRIAALLPEKYHGFYKDHPRLKELLNTQI